MVCQPLIDRFSFMNTIVVYHDIDTRHPGSRIRALQQGQKVTKQTIVLAWAKAMQELASGEIERTSQVVLLVLARRHDLFLASFGPPGRPDLGQQVNIEFISKDHHLMVLQGFGLIPDTSQTLEPFGIVIFSYQLGPLGVLGDSYAFIFLLPI